MLDKVRYLLLQIRNSNDPMRQQEVQAFARTLECDASAISTFDLLGGRPSRSQFDAVDVVLFGGSGHYSAAGSGAWLELALDVIREIYEMRKPTFASCWGFQAVSRALGGRVIKDPPNAELGTIELHLTDAGRDDPVFAPLGDTFGGQSGHEDHVVELPGDAVLLASSERVREQAYRLKDRPFYCTQFHPELNVDNLMQRVTVYPEYVERIAGMTLEQFHGCLRETPEAAALMPRFVRHVLEA